jgi:hypothetical protein
MGKNFKNPWAKGGELYPYEVLNASSVLDASKTLEKQVINNSKVAGALEVTSIEGPFKKSKPTVKVKAVSRKHGYYYFATVKNLTKLNYKQVNWAVSYDDFDAYNSYLLFNGGTIVDGKLRVEIITKKAKDKFKIYAYTGILPSNSIYTECYFKKSINLFIGGAGDKESYSGFGPTKIVENQIKSKYSNTLDSSYKLDYIDAYLSYKEAYKNKIDTVILPILKSKDICSVNIIGHSLGGWNGAHLSSILSQKGFKVKLLATIDPVGTKVGVTLFSDIYWDYPIPIKEYWINIKSDSSKFTTDNIIADLGGQWDPKSSANRNTKVLFTHAEAGKMFFNSEPKLKLNPSDYLDLYIQSYLDEE